MGVVSGLQMKIATLTSYFYMQDTEAKVVISNDRGQAQSIRKHFLTCLRAGVEKTDQDK